MLLMQHIRQQPPLHTIPNSSRRRNVVFVAVVVVIVVAFLLHGQTLAIGSISGSPTQTDSHCHTDREQAELGATKPKPETPAENLALLFKFLCNLELFVSCVSEFAATVCREESSEILLCREIIYNSYLKAECLEPS